MNRQYSLPQAERINSKKLIDRIFRGGGSKAMTASPLRMVFLVEDRDAGCRQPAAQMMVSVPKRYFKRAVKRNLIKRQVREAYRLNKHLLPQQPADAACRTVYMCFIWTDSRVCATADVMKQMQNLLTRLAERMARHD